MSLKRTLTAVAVDSAKEYLQEKLVELKQLDLDKDGQKDVDQIMVLVNHIADKVKISIETTDFQKLAAGLDQVMSGAGLIGDSVDREKLADALKELGSGLTKLGTLLHLGVREIKERDGNL